MTAVLSSTADRPVRRRRARRACWLAGVWVAAVGQPLAADQVSIVADVSQKVGWWAETLSTETIPRYVELAGALYYFHDDGIHGRELWRTDGTAAGTHLVRDICPGACGSGSWQASGLVAMGGALYFPANDGTHGSELWRSDGTAAGTTLVKDIWPGLDPSSPTQLTLLGGSLYLWADDGVHGAELWQSDGTAPGTALAVDVVPGPDGSRTFVSAVVGGRLVFRCCGWTSPSLWASDGTPLGTAQISAVNPVAQSVAVGQPFLVLPNGLLLFSADGGGGVELWRSDGTAGGTYLLADLEPGPGLSYPHDFVVMGGDLYFSTQHPDNTQRLWRTDGTLANTVPVNLPPGVEPRMYAGRFGALPDRLVFRAQDAVHGIEPWVTDGTTATLLADVYPGAESSYPMYDFVVGLSMFASVGDHVVFLANDGVHGDELWTTDGTPAGTQLLAELVPGAASTFLDYFLSWAEPAVLAGKLLFRDYSADFGRRLWSTDGTPAGTSLVEVIGSQTSVVVPEGPLTADIGSLPIGCFGVAGGRLLFGADDGVHGIEAWISDGTELGTELLVDLGVPPSDWAYPLGCHGVGGLATFTAQAGNPAVSGWWSVDPADGSAERLRTYEPYGSAPIGTWLGGSRYLLDTFGIFRSDGTAPGTEDIGPLATCEWEGYYGLLASDDQLFATLGCGISTSRGVPGDVEELTYFGQPFVDASRLARVGKAIFFAATHPSDPAELWRTDGTPQGTLPLADVRPGPEPGLVRFGSEPPRVAVTAERYLFVGDDGVHGAELWSSDGTPAGTALVADLVPGPVPSWPRLLTAFDGQVFFVAEAPGTGRELWRSDGTAAGTVLVADLVPGAESSLPQALAVADGKLYFSAWDPVHGREAWRVLPSSGSHDLPPVVERVTDIAVGPRSSSPQAFASVGGTVYTLASDNVRGFELWKIVEEGLIFRDGFESEDTESWPGVVP